MDFIGLLLCVKEYEIFLYDEIKSRCIFKPENKDELKCAVNMYTKNQNNCINRYGEMELWDVSDITNMRYMFSYNNYSRFGDYILDWDVSNVTDMSVMFINSVFYGNISLWDVSNVETMRGMFYSSMTITNINMWDISKVSDMVCMFQGSNFNKDISNWDLSEVEYCMCMFKECYINYEYKPLDIMYR